MKFITDSGLLTLLGIHALKSWGKGYWGARHQVMWLWGDVMWFQIFLSDWRLGGDHCL